MMTEKQAGQGNHLEVAISRESYDPKNTIIDYDLDPFAVQEAQKSDDYLEFRSLSWFKAGLLACAEVRTCIDNTDISSWQLACFRTLPFLCDWAWSVAYLPH